ncbi:MAG TPA: ribonuclease E/G, partial [Hyphomicrobiaceae bacterium]|nr:ribonuclease E/G [Hyphomicrobiaceae bacterium]
LEAAEELSRQLKLRDLAGLIVIDFIDMDEKRNNRAVERKLKDCLKYDRARIQVGRISHFGLLEMSRQRLRTGVLEGSTMQCAHCQGTGTIRSTESVALAVLRSLEDNLMGNSPRSLVASTAPNVALYLLNQKRGFIQDMEARYGVVLHIQASDTQQGANFTIERLSQAGIAESTRRIPDASAVSMQSGFAANSDDDDRPAPTEQKDRSDGPADVAGEASGDEKKSRRRRRRRGGRRDEAGRDETGDDAERVRDDRGSSADTARADDPADDTGADNDNSDVETQDGTDDAEGGRRRPRRRGRRGGRRNREQRETATDGVDVPGAPQPDLAENGSRPWNGTTVEERPADSGAHAAASDTTASDTTSDPVAEPVDGGKETPFLSADDAKSRPQEPAAAAVSQPETVEPAAALEGSEAGREREHAPAAVASQETVPAADADAAPVKPTPAAPAEAVAPMVEAQPEKPSSPGAAPVAAKPRFERIVVKPDQTTIETEATAEPGNEAQQPAQKKGWWQRKFGA